MVIFLKKKLPEAVNSLNTVFKKRLPEHVCQEDSEKISGALMNLTLDVLEWFLKL